MSSHKDALEDIAISEIITTSDLSKSFNGFTAVDRISFSVHTGEVFGFLGPNGAGKTTTIKMLTTLLHPSSGHATINGFDIVRQRDKVRESIGVVFQEPALELELTGKENLDFHARMYGLPKDQRLGRIDEVLTLVDLQEKKNALVKTYSGGMKRRLEIARGLMHSPTVLFLDEPTLGLDAQTRRAIWEYIRRMNREERTTIFLTTHYMDEADYLCGRIGIIDHGHILVMDSVAALKRSVGSDLITLSCSDPQALASLVSKEGWVSTLKEADGALTLSVDHGEEKVPAIVELARIHGIAVRSISVRQPTLDDVFLHYTGRSMRDSDQVAKKDDHRQWRWRRR